MLYVCFELLVMTNFVQTLFVALHSVVAPGHGRLNVSLYKRPKSQGFGREDGKALLAIFHGFPIQDDVSSSGNGSTLLPRLYSGNRCLAILF
jgi:hypothetical protein